MSYIFLHLEIRNDLHCPICRKFYVSIHESQDQALKKAPSHDDEDDDNEDYVKSLKKGQVLWIDEWVRRRNGDSYQIKKLKANFTYDLSVWDIDNCEDHNYEETNCEEENDGKFQYMLLRVAVDKSEWCPENICFFISFHKSLDTADKKMLSFVDEDDRDKLIGIDKIKNKLCRFMVKGIVNIIINYSGKSLEPIWINNEQGNGGDYYQIIPLVENKTFYLNQYCPQIQPDVWE